MQTETELKRADTSLETLVNLATTVPIITIISGKHEGKKTCAILISLGLKKYGKAIFFYNLDKETQFPTIVPQDKNPDLIVINCPLECSHILLALPTKNRINLLVIGDDPTSISDSYFLLKIYGRLELGLKRFYCLAHLVQNRVAGIDSFNKLNEIISRFLDLESYSLFLLGNIPYCEEISNFGHRQYTTDDLNYALSLYEDTIKELLVLLDN